MGVLCGRRIERREIGLSGAFEAMQADEVSGVVETRVNVKLPPQVPRVSTG